jgi:hypothetical protein
LGISNNQSIPTNLICGKFTTNPKMQMTGLLGRKTGNKNVNHEGVFSSENWHAG